MGGYTGVAQNQMLALVTLFDSKVPDAEVHQHLAVLIADTNRWREAHGYLSEVRRRLNASKERPRQLQYSFVEACLKTIFNETPTKAPFDSISPFWVVPAALALATELAIPLERVTACLTASQHEGLGRPAASSGREPRAVFLYGDGGLHVEPSVSQAAAYMEPIDVQNGEYEAVFDDSGRRYDWNVVDGATRLKPTGEVDLDGLLERLRQDPSIQSLVGADVEHPMQAAAAIAEWRWERRWPRWPKWLSRRIHGDRPRITE